ncbi:MAG: DnaJ domain-containing protein [Clostridia bacterium]|nr:DnaJ domain-containing protein [Clostridia bacterium]
MSESILNPFMVLEISEDADAEAVKAAYRRLVKRWHPDQFTDSTEQEIAQTHLVQLNLAYQEALKAVGSRRAAHVAPDLPLREAKSLSKRLLGMKQYESALRQLARTREKDAEYYYIEGQILTALRQYGSAHQAFRAAVQMEPTNREYHRAAFNAAMNYKKHRRLPYRVADWAGSILRPRREAARTTRQ